MDDTSTEFGPRYDEMTTPGRDEGVITDGQILAAVQAVLNA